MAYRLSGLDAVETWMATNPQPVAQARMWEWLLELAERPHEVPAVPLPGTIALVHVFSDDEMDVAVTFVIVEQFRDVHLVKVETLHDPFFET